MRNLSLLSSLVLLLFLTSCQREVDGFGNTPTPRLVRMVAKSGNDSTVRNFVYDGSGRIVRVSSAGVNSGQPVDLDVKYLRNGSGLIQKMVTTSSYFAALGIDSLETMIGSANGRYTFSKTSISFMGFTLTDSTAYQYDGAGRVISEISYQRDPIGGTYQPGSKIEYAYTGANLTSTKQYSYDNNTSNFTLEAESTYEYDQKINPLQFTRDAVILGMSEFFPANNTTKSTQGQPTVTSPGAEITTTTYTYSEGNRPLSASANSSATGTTQVTYTYQ